MCGLKGFCIAIGHFNLIGINNNNKRDSNSVECNRQIWSHHCQFHVNFTASLMQMLMNDSLREETTMTTNQCNDAAGTATILHLYASRLYELFPAATARCFPKLHPV